jgi:ribose transport system ATP-binding protein
MVEKQLSYQILNGPVLRILGPGNQETLVTRFFMRFLHMAFVVEFQHVTKRFPGVQALSDVSFGVHRGTVHCLVGENGAGKSTLIKILSGAYKMDFGEIIFEGRPVKIDSPHEAQKYKINLIYQEQNLIPKLTVRENITLGTESTKLGLIRKKEEYCTTLECLNKLSLNVDVNGIVSGLSVAEKQMVSIAKALHLESKLIVMDEATSSLTVHEQYKLFEVIESLKSHGVTVIYISHNLDEVFQIGESITVLRDGKHMGTFRIEDVTKEEVIRMMVGRKLTDTYTVKPEKKKVRMLSLRNVTKKNQLHTVSFDLYAGEIVGVYGLVGSGRTELARVLFGAEGFDGGEIILDGRSISPTSPRRALSRGIALIPEDRRTHGIIGLLNVRSNISLSSLKAISHFGVVMKRKDRQLAHRYVKELSIKTPSIEQQVQFLSGGNQQKVVISKVLSTNPKVLLMDEPTRGIDVGAKSEIFRIMRELSERDVAIIMFSSELQEVLKMSDRILVMHDGMIVKELDPSLATQDQVLRYAIGEEEEREDETES